MNQLLNPVLRPIVLSHPAIKRTVFSTPCQGFSLIELTIVILILSIVAVVAMPNVSTGDEAKLELASQEVAQAMRFARSESLRIGEPRGFRQQSSPQRIRVFRADMGTSPPTLVYDVYHPVSKHLYDIELDKHAFAAVGTISHNRTYRGTCNNPGNVYFDANGTPWCADPENILLEQFDITLSLGAHTRVVTLNGITGRVTVQ